MERFRTFAQKTSHNNTRTVYVLKCDIRRFFASIDHRILEEILKRYISDIRILSLLKRVIESFSIGDRGLPLGNLTSQLFVNIYMNEFDQFVKHTLKAKAYVRYADDFVLLSQDKGKLEQFLPHIKAFLWDRLHLTLHPNKVFIKTLASGVDFLGWVHFPDHRVVRTATKHRMYRRLQQIEWDKQSVQSYLGLLNHGNSWKLQQRVNTNVAATSNRP